LQRGAPHGALFGGASGTEAPFIPPFVPSLWRHEPAPFLLRALIARGGAHAHRDDGIYAVFIPPPPNQAVYANYFMVSNGMFISIPGDPPS
jgi:hypothetical protein